MASEEFDQLYGLTPSALPSVAPISGGGSDEFEQMYGIGAPGSQVPKPNDAPGFGSMALGALETVTKPLSYMKQGVDYLARKGAEFRGLQVPDTATTGSMLREAAGLSTDPLAGQPENAGSYGRSLGGKALEFGTDIGTDPLTFALGGAPKVAKYAGLAMAPGMLLGGAKEAAGAVNTFRNDGFTPQVAEQGLGALLSGGMGILAARHGLAPGESAATPQVPVPNEPNLPAVTLDAPLPEPVAPGPQPVDTTAQQATADAGMLKGVMNQRQDALQFSDKRDQAETRTIEPKIAQMSDAELMAREKTYRRGGLNGSADLVTDEIRRRMTPEQPKAELIPEPGIEPALVAEPLPEPVPTENAIVPEAGTPVDTGRRLPENATQRSQIDELVKNSSPEQLRAEHPETWKLIYGDEVSGLQNRKGWTKALATLGENDHVAVVDLKKFKPLNDTYGHDAGDIVLRSVGDVLRKHFGDADSARFGGDEFGAIVRGATPEEAQTRAEAFKQDLAQTSVRIGGPNGEVLDIPGVEAHIGVGKDFHEADTRLNKGAAPSREGGRGQEQPAGVGGAEPVADGLSSQGLEDPAAGAQEQLTPIEAEFGKGFKDLESVEARLNELRWPADKVAQLTPEEIKGVLERSEQWPPGKPGASAAIGEKASGLSAYGYSNKSPNERFAIDNVPPDHKVINNDNAMDVLRASVEKGETALARGEKPKYRAGETPTIPSIDKDTVKRAFAVGAVEERAPGHWEVGLPGGRRIQVKVTPEGIELNPEAFKAGYGRDKSGAEQIVGAWQKIGRDGIISLAKEADEATVHHEAFHGAMDLALSEKEKAAVLKKYGNEEAAAEAYAKWNPSEVNSWFSKLYAFAKRIYRAFRPSWESTFQETREGRVWSREPSEKRNATSLAKRPDRLRDDAVMGRNFSDGPSETIQSDRFSNVPSDMARHMLGVSDDPKVLGSVVAPDMVDVMDLLRGKKVSAEHLGGDDAMLENHLSSKNETSVPLAVNVADSAGRRATTLLGGVARPIAKLSDATDSGRVPVELTAAEGALARNRNDIHDGEYSRTQVAEQANSPKYSSRSADKLHEPAKAPEPPKEPTLADQGLEIWKANMLTGPGTHVANAVGNTGEQSIRVGETGTSALVDRMLGGERSRFGGEVGAEVRGGLSNIGTHIKKLGGDIKDALTLAEEKHDPNMPEERQTGAVPGKAGRAVRIPFRLLGAMDNLFKGVGGDAELGKLSYRQAASELGSGASKADIQSRANEIMANPSKDMLDAVDKSRQDRTYQTRAEPGEILDALLKFREKHKWFNAILPFATTPANIADLTLKRTPYGFKEGAEAYKAWKTAEKSGAPAAEITRLKGEAADKLARPLLGTALIGTFAAIAKAGGMTGSGPVDQKEKANLRATGWQPYSFILPGPNGKKVFLPFNRFEPLSSALGFAADAAEAPSAKDGQDALNKFMGSLVSNLSSKTYLQGLSDVADLLNDPARAAGQYTSNLAGSLVPAIVGKAAQAIDPVLRETKSDATGLSGLPQRIARTLESKIPGLSQNLPAKRETTGGDIERPGNAVSRFLSPVQPSVEKDDSALETLLGRIDAIPSDAPRVLSIPGSTRKVPLDDKERAVLQDATETASSQLRKIADNPAFLNLPEEVQKKIIDNVYETARRAARFSIYGMSSFRAKMKSNGA